jgi:hypothetical protein
VTDDVAGTPAARKSQCSGCSKRKGTPAPPTRPDDEDDDDEDDEEDEGDEQGDEDGSEHNGTVVEEGVMGRGLHSFPFPLNLSLRCPFPLNSGSLCPPYTPN